MKLWNNFQFTIVLLCLCFLINNESEARHIIGGYTYYEHVSGDRYRITMNMYRDCNSQGADFDAQAAIGVFHRSSPNDPYRLVDQRRITLRQPTSFVELNRRPCIDYPRDTCVQLGVYEFEHTLSIPGGDYVFAYQRCCRNDGIRNIVYETCGVGSTFFVEITEYARSVENNSPRFNEFPPIVICAEFDFEYDNSAFDEDGDLLVYEFCSPKNGGGLGGIDPNCGTTNSFGGVMPNPPSNPPYRNVLFGTGYSRFQPIPGNPPLTVNNNTGFMTGYPTETGLFAVGVCIKEYRDGNLLGSYIRDFQFFVTDCDPSLRADVEEDYRDEQGRLVLDRCGEKNVFLQNTSEDRNDIFSYRWELDLAEGKVDVNTYDLTYAFPDYGNYEVTLFINEGETCADTADIMLNLYPGIESDFDYIIDSCEVRPVEFTSLSSSGSGMITEHKWSFDDGSSGIGDEIDHLFLQGGTYNVRLEVTDSNNCEDVKVIPVPYYPTPELLIVSPNIAVGCAPQAVFFDNLTEVITDEYLVIWDFGDGQVDTALSPTHIYEEPGEYTVSVAITSPIGCKLSREFGRILRINPSPTAAFDYDPKELNRFNTEVQFDNQSSGHVGSQWRFGDGSRVNLDNPRYVFADTGIYRVELIVRNEFNCLDTATAVLDIYPSVTHFLPNAFTPNFDGTNDVYRPSGVFDGIRDYAMQIFDRYGQKVFETSDPIRGWDGSNMNNGKDCGSGGYMVLVQFSDPRGVPRKEKTMVTLFR